MDGASKLVGGGVSIFDDRLGEMGAEALVRLSVIAGIRLGRFGGFVAGGFLDFFRFFLTGASSGLEDCRSVSQDLKP